MSLRPPAVLLPAIRPPDVLLLLWHPLRHFEMARGATRALPAAALRVLRYTGAEGGSTGERASVRLAAEPSVMFPSSKRGTKQA